MNYKQLKSNQRPQNQIQILQHQSQLQNLFNDEDKSINAQLFKTFKQPPRTIPPINQIMNFHQNQLKMNPFRNTQQKVNQNPIDNRQLKQSQLSASTLKNNMSQYSHSNQIVDNVKNQYFSPQQQNVQVLPYKLIQQSRNNQNAQFMRIANTNNQQEQLNIQNRDQTLQQQLGFNQLVRRPYQSIFKQSGYFQKRQLLLEELRMQKEIQFDNDDYIVPLNNQINQNSSISDLLSKVSFEIKCLQKECKLKISETQYLPAMVSVKTQDFDSMENERRVGLDLICLIDKSGSMARGKIEMVQQTLKVLLEFLGEQDRLQLITFHQKAQQLTPLKCVNENNKEYFKLIIDQIMSMGGTRISEATNLAFQQLNCRKYKNNVSSIFLLSDGHDPLAFSEIQQQIGIVKDPFTLHTFGFGDSHDAELMTSICNLKNGSFYFVQDITLLDEFFIDALGGLISVIGEEVQIQLVSDPQKPFQDIRISKTYGNMWKQINQTYQINFPQLISGTRKDFVFEIEIPKFTNNVSNQQLKLINAQINIKNPMNGNIIQKQAHLYLTFYNPDQNILTIEEDPDVQTQYFRVKGTEAIDEARKACEVNKFDDAQARINHILIQIQQNQKVATLCAGIIQDLDQAKQASLMNSYKAFGQKQLYQMVTNNYLQSGINSIFSANGQQLQQKQPAHFSNTIQQFMMSKVQNQKSRQHY